MALTGTYVPSKAEWVRKQVEQYEASGGEKANTLPGTQLPDRRHHVRRREVGQPPQEPGDARRARRRLPRGRLQGRRAGQPGVVLQLRRRTPRSSCRTARSRTSTGPGSWRVTSAPTGGSTPSPRGRRTPPTRRRPTGRSRSSCSSAPEPLGWGGTGRPRPPRRAGWPHNDAVTTALPTRSAFDEPVDNPPARWVGALVLLNLGVMAGLVRADPGAARRSRPTGSRRRARRHEQGGAARGRPVQRRRGVAVRQPGVGRLQRPYALAPGSSGAVGARWGGARRRVAAAAVRRRQRSVDGHRLVPRAAGAQRCVGRRGRGRARPGARSSAAASPAASSPSPAPSACWSASRSRRSPARSPRATSRSRS